jgi:drug/metabolite transporter (DMT)-like permease
MIGILFLLIRVIASPLVNLFQKKLINHGVNPVFIVLIAYAFFSTMAIPYLILSKSYSYNREFWIYMILLGISDAFGNMFLVRSLKSIDISIFGPLNAYKPVVALLLSFLIIKEIPSIAGIIGIAVIISGSYILNMSEKGIEVPFWTFMKAEGIGYRFLSIILTSIAAVLSKKVILMSSPLITLSFWSLIGMPFVLLLFLIKNKSVHRKYRKPDASSIWFYTGLLFTFLLLQIFSLYTFKYVFIGYSLALFQLSAVINVFIGSRIFNEGNIKFRYIASAVMIIGACIIIIFG